MTLNKNLYYYCDIKKPPMSKIIRYCSKSGCRHLMTRPRKNLIRKRRKGYEDLVARWNSNRPECWII